MTKFMRTMKPALVLFGVMTLLCGVVYPAVVTGVAQWWFPDRANGSVIAVTLADGSRAEYSSALIAQQLRNRNT